MAQGRFCEHKDHGPDQTLIVAIVGIGDGNGTMTWLCQEHFNDAMYQLGQLLRSLKGRSTSGVVITSEDG